LLCGPDLLNKAFKNPKIISSFWRVGDLGQVLKVCKKKRQVL